jgi:TPR repeat protein
MGALSLKATLPELPSQPNADALFRMGLRYSTPAAGGADDPVTAHALFDLAARLGSLEAKIYRRELSDEMDPDDIAEANRVVREWLACA